MNEIVLLESISLRDQLCTDGNTSVLEKVGKLVFFSGASYSNAQSIAQFYGVELNTLQQVIKRHRDELAQDGYKMLYKNDLQNVHGVQLETIKIPNRGIAVFSRRAILRLGMLLRDSTVAKLVRSYLLNIEERASIDYGLEKMMTRIATQMDEQAGQLIKHADYFGEQTSELKNHAKQLKVQTEMIKALLEEVYVNRKRIEQVEGKVEKSEKRLTSLEALTKELSVETRKVGNRKAKARREGETRKI